MRFEIITIFPEFFDALLKTSIIGRAIEKKFIEINIVDLRVFTSDRHRTVDGRPYGGGPGMLMKAEPLFLAVENLRRPDSKVILLGACGKRFDQAAVVELTKDKHLIIICGHYEGVDERVREALVDMEISVGDYVLTNGNIPAMILVDAVSRLIPGVLGCEESVAEESFSEGLLEYPQYTRPEDFRGMKVPEILLSGDHRRIAEWRRGKSIEKTKNNRPDLWEIHNKKMEKKR